MANKFNPQADAARYKKIVEDRGYDAFSQPMRDAWEQENGHLGYDDLKTLTDGLSKAFLDSLADPNHRSFESNRKKFKDEFGSSEAAVKEHYKNQVNVQNGRPFKGNHGFYKDSSHEQRMLQTQPVSNKAAEGERQLLNDVMKSRWAAQGYTETPGHPDNDSAYLDNFYNSYCLALRPAQSRAMAV